MITIGITGGMGSGKSTVAGLWKTLGAYVLNADDLAKQLMTEDPEIKKAITDTFGEGAYSDDGSLNRSYLAKEAFAKGRVQELNNIVHPRIPSEVKKIMDRAEQNGYPVFVYEAALLLQRSRPEFLDYIVLVLADLDKRLNRVMGRDNTSKRAILDRINMQQDFNELKDQADIIIENNGTLNELKSKSGQLFQVLTESEPDIKR